MYPPVMLVFTDATSWFLHCKVSLVSGYFYPVANYSGQQADIMVHRDDHASDEHPECYIYIGFFCCCGGGYSARVASSGAAPILKKYGNDSLAAIAREVGTMLQQVLESLHTKLRAETTNPEEARECIEVQLLSRATAARVLSVLSRGQ